MIVLYDGDCGFCRWSVGQVLRLDRGGSLVPVPIQSQLGSELLEDLCTADRLAAAHVVGEDGQRRSGGAAAAEVLAAIDRTGLLSRLARSSPRATSWLYDALASRRGALGRLLGRSARERADRLLERSRVTTEAQLRTRMRSPS